MYCLLCTASLPARRPRTLGEAALKAETPLSLAAEGTRSGLPQTKGAVRVLIRSLALWPLREQAVSEVMMVLWPGAAMAGMHGTMLNHVVHVHSLLSV